MRYGVAIGRGDLYEPGTYTIRAQGRMAALDPTRNMIKREPEIYAQLRVASSPAPRTRWVRARFTSPGRPQSYLRIHGTRFPTSIGSRASSGCVRMVMAHINGLYPPVHQVRPPISLAGRQRDGDKLVCCPPAILMVRPVLRCRFGCHSRPAAAPASFRPDLRGSTNSSHHGRGAPWSGPG